MGTIVPRKRKDNTTGYSAQIVIKRDGRIVHRETQTFDRRQAAAIWLEKREKELQQPDGLQKAKRADATLSDIIDRYIRESKKDLGRTKAQVLRSIKGSELGQMMASEIGSPEITEFVSELSKRMKPQTVENYLSHLSAVFRVARPAWGYPLDMQAMSDARVVAKSLGTTGKSDKRDRRPEMDELDNLMAFFVERNARRDGIVPMERVIAFGIFSTRRQEEITRLRWADLDTEGKRILVRDMKHPGQKKGNDVWVDLPDQALKIIEAMPKVGERIFPYTTDAISAAFTRACYTLGINTEDMPDSERLVFHDLRHEGVSRLFEMGWNIPHVAAVSGHRSWNTLKRYTHMKQTGDKYANWKWLPVVTAIMKRDEE